MMKCMYTCVYTYMYVYICMYTEELCLVSSVGFAYIYIYVYVNVCVYIYYTNMYMIVHAFLTLVQICNDV